MDYGIRVWRSVEEVPIKGQTEDSALPMNNLSADIYYKSGFVAKRYCFWPLVGTELAAIWGMEQQIASLVRNPRDLPIVPFTFANQILGGYLDKIGLAIQLRHTSQRMKVPKVVEDSGGIWLEDLQRTLPNVWRTKGIANLQSAKDDDADVQFEMWDYRIITLFPHIMVTFLKHFQLVLRQRKRRLFLEFVRWLWVTYPLDYPIWLKHKGALAPGGTCLSP